MHGLLANFCYVMSLSGMRWDGMRWDVTFFLQLPGLALIGMYLDLEGMGVRKSKSRDRREGQRGSERVRVRINIRKREE